MSIENLTKEELHQHSKKLMLMAVSAVAKEMGDAELALVALLGYHPDLTTNALLTKIAATVVMTEKAEQENPALRELEPKLNEDLQKAQPETYSKPAEMQADK